MKKVCTVFCIPVLLVLFTQCAGAKESKCSIGFKDSIATADKSKDKDLIYQFDLAVEINKPDSLKNYTVTVTADNQASTLPAHDYEIDFKETKTDALAGAHVYLKLKQDGNEDRARTLLLKLRLKKADGKDADPADNDPKANTELLITVNAYKADTLNGYNYLAYIGTNFDLVDGIKAKNLFFASNIFVPPSEKNTAGFSLTLYGNRTMSVTDTNGKASYTSRILRLDDSTGRYYSSTALKTQTRVSDNLGASFSPLVRLWGLSNERNKIQIYFAPTAEFIWRRATTTITYTDAHLTDSTDRHIALEGSLETPDKISSNMNIFDFYAGYLGFMIRHESSVVSMRLQFTVGTNLNYMPIVSGSNVVSTKYTETSDLFFLGRVWITEPHSGITIEAEITNNHKTPQPYYGVTLSKAINLRSLGTIFQPVSRS
jgi:hypothetical protein